MPKPIGRNDPCPCGSGKKYKKCCLPIAEAAEREPPSHIRDDFTDEPDSISEESERMEKVWAQHPEYARFRDSDLNVTENGVNPHVHVTIHTVVENQLAANDPPETAEALKRLRKAGYNRHDAIHAIGILVAKLVWSTLKKKKPADMEAYCRALRDLGCF